ncbi:MAG: HutD family protein [Rhodospirillaceae bacterium]|nr:HutD family protein [Rhodospirillaceae bacterium]
MQVLRQADYRRMPWKNGGGETTEVTVSPPGAGFDTFDWRISMALVKGDGPFSVFPGIDRTLSILDGNGMRLDIDGARFDLTRASAPLAFPADVATDAVLMDGAITDLNVMSRRTVFRHQVERFDLGAARTFTSDADVMAVLADTGRITVTASESTALGPRDTAIFQAPGAVAVAAKDTARGYVISFWKI